MATSLYDLSVPTFLQTLRAVGGFLERTARHCAQTHADPNDFVHARLFEDMAPFHFQIEAVWHHAADRELDLQIGPRRLVFTAETLILSFSLPNFYFHAVTAYDALRARGVPLGKRDYEGCLRTRTA